MRRTPETGSERSSVSPRDFANERERALCKTTSHPLSLYFRTFSMNLLQIPQDSTLAKTSVPYVYHYISIYMPYGI